MYPPANTSFRAMSPPAIPSTLWTLLSTLFLFTSISSYSFYSHGFHPIFVILYNSYLLAVKQKWTLSETNILRTFISVSFSAAEIGRQFCKLKEKIHMQMEKLSDQWLRIRHRSSVRVHFCLENLFNCCSHFENVEKCLFWEKHSTYCTVLDRSQVYPVKMYMYFHFRP